MKRLLLILLLFLCIPVILIFTFGCSLIRPSFSPKKHQERIRAFPKVSTQIQTKTSIRWNKYQVPYVISESDEDAFFALGAIHAHLRLGQMEIFRRASQGRLAEIAGPVATDIDHTLRIIDLGKASAEIFTNMDQESKKLLLRFVEGLNWYQNSITELPVEYSIFDIEPTTWQPEEIITLSRLVGVDLSWIFYISFLRMEDEVKRQELWERFLVSQPAAPESFSIDPKIKRLAALFTDNSKSGSNSVVISNLKSANQSALIANDPHLGISVPNFWLLAGVRSPSFQVVGMMIPGLPFFALGRNPEISWGGTNMRGISSHLHRLTPEQSAEINEEKVTITVRWWFNSDRTVRTSPLGPILSDSPFLEHLKEPIAINWQGHSTDANEIGAFLNANRASDWNSFKSSFENYAVSAQNILYADSDGNIGQLLAYRKPILKEPSKTLQLIKDGDNPVIRAEKPTELPYAYNPPSNFIASANNKPTESDIPFAYTYSSHDRIARLQKVISETDILSVDDLKRLQVDVYAASLHELQHTLKTGLDIDTPLWRAFKNWDGELQKDSREALAAHLVLTSFAKQVISKTVQDEDVVKMMTRGPYWLKTVQDFISAPENHSDARAMLLKSLEEAESSFRRYNNWGDLHRLRIQHPAGNIPVIGSNFRFLELPASGGNNTLLKTAHRLTEERHRVTYGAQARHISDLSDPDTNYFTLLGGQDGWLKSENMIDQIPLWTEGEYIQLPLTPEKIEVLFPVTTTLK